jgi:tRNA (guanine-N7-)-methyltransferase
LKGQWNELVFQNSNPITLELACGKGEYTLALARQFPARNFIGLDIKGARIWRGAKMALEEKISNVAFLRTYIDHIEDYFTDAEVEEIWITFPDPYPEKSKARKRLTSELFLPRYKKILKPGGIIHLKTDDLQLYQFTLEKIEEFKCHILFVSEDLYASPLPDEILAEKTFYEQQHLAKGKSIKYIRFRFQ